MARSSFVRRTLAARPIGERDVILVPIGGKLRPAICLRKMQGHGDFLVCAVSTQLDQYIEGFDEILEPDEVERPKNEVKVIIKKSVIRLGCLERVESHALPGSMGYISFVKHRCLLKKLSDYLISTKTTTPA